VGSARWRLDASSSTAFDQPAMRVEMEKLSRRGRMSVFIRPRAPHGDTVHNLLHEPSAFRFADALLAFCRLVLVPGPWLNRGGLGEAGARRS